MKYLDKKNKKTSSSNKVKSPVNSVKPKSPDTSYMIHKAPFMRAKAKALLLKQKQKS
jgi:hypothetical protein